jgi:hypothetical protein
MSNMSYCRFHNTRGDLADCVEALNDREPLSASEAKEAARLAELCREYLDAYDPDDIPRECDNCGEAMTGEGKMCAECIEAAIEDGEEADA